MFLPISKRNLLKDLESIIKTLSEGLINIDFEVICVVDGKMDNTYEEAKKTKSDRLKFLSIEKIKVKVMQLDLA